MPSFLINLLGGGIFKAFSNITTTIEQMQQNRLNAKNNEDRVRLEGDIALLNTQREIYKAELSNKRTSWVRPSFCFLFFIYLAKIIIYDKILELGATDPLSPQLEYIMFGFLGVYFVGRPLEKIFGGKK